MDSENTTLVKLSIPKSTKVSYVTTATGEIGSLKLVEPHISLVRGRLYRLPVNTRDSLDSNNIFKAIGKIAEILDIRNIEDGFVTVLPVVHNVHLKDGMELGHFI